MSTAHASAGLRTAGLPNVFVVMGVSGSGKSTIAAKLASALGWPLVEGDSLHPKANIEKMSAGIPLTDDDRLPWLGEIASIIAGWVANGEHGIVTCSALKVRYRELLRGQSDKVCFAYVKGTKEQIGPRLQRRQGHFMPSTMLESQFQALEEPSDNEVVLELDVTASPDTLATDAVALLETLAK